MGTDIHKWKKQPGTDTVICLYCRLERRKHGLHNSTLARYTYLSQDGEVVSKTTAPDCRTKINLIKG